LTLKNFFIEIQIDLFPFYSERSQAQLMTDERKQKFLEWLVEISDINEEYKEQIKKGKNKKYEKLRSYTGGSKSRRL